MHKLPLKQENAEADMSALIQKKEEIEFIYNS
jgi:hypothetical protein